MCLRPKIIYIERGPNWEPQEVACRHCWQCRKLRIDDYVGRALCEASSNDWSISLTLTYRNNPSTPLAEKIIYPPDFQNFIRALRDRNHKIRYICSGEVGSLRGRAHFHCILFGRGPSLNYPQDVRFWDEDVWPHGHMHCDNNISGRSFGYVLKYNFKDYGGDDLQKQSWFTLSKKPPLGDEYFQKLAVQRVADGAFPTSLQYTPPNFPESKARYVMSGRTRFNFLIRLSDLWLTRFPLSRSNLSENMVEMLDNTFKQEHRASCTPSQALLTQQFVEFIEMKQRDVYLSHKRVWYEKFKKAGILR